MTERTTRRVVSTKPNASSNISGVRFEACPKGMVSELISDEQADRFLTIPGYVEFKTNGTNGVVNYGKMPYEAVVQLLTDEPGLHEDVLKSEAKRQSPRKKVLIAIETAKSQLKL